MTPYCALCGLCARCVVCACVSRLYTRGYKLLGYMLCVGIGGVWVQVICAGMKTRVGGVYRCSYGVRVCIEPVQT
jgi:hypothetical protein